MTPERNHHFKPRQTNVWSRREWLRVGGLGALGVSLPQLLRGNPSAAAISRAASFGRAKSCIILFLSGGPPQHETFDPKPDAPVDIRGTFRPISTSVPGMQFCETLPHTAKVAHHLAVGFTDLVVYTNDCSDGTDDMLIRLEELGLAHHRRNVIPEGIKPQPSALNYAQDEPVVRHSDWVMVFDADEFLSIRHGDGTLDGLYEAVLGAEVAQALLQQGRDQDAFRIASEAARGSAGTALPGYVAGLAAWAADHPDRAQVTDASVAGCGCSPPCSTAPGLGWRCLASRCSWSDAKAWKPQPCWPRWPPAPSWVTWSGAG